ncbi:MULTISPECIES: replication-associated recombination protein A [Helicobacter]|uniref:Replication-associated recombination protein A n=2 Tax=Helicobacter typhlonius TaxID=76936 RepID=A0A099UFI2_9HELI|nr:MULTISPECIES: replication-associated recombination protein A [Helicobacter]TLD78509.1 replication-associated recombination protein A [Helicobacter typhlonius]TLD88812.1 replication-associated recombination protein A [Helicobacter sp. MIT 03-1616]CUU39771.1 ATPase, AAA family [Helicobacter typhlonius]
MLNLASLLRPTALEDFIAQEHILSPQSTLLKMLKNNALAHCFFYGPPGVGKTTLAQIIAETLNKPFASYNATSFKIEELRQFVKGYEGSLYQPLVFIDEVHRLNRAQQEVLLPIMESYSAIVCGASTYNPFISLTNAIRSRSFLFELKPLTNQSLNKILTRALAYIESHLCIKVQITQEAQTYLITSSAGDARALLNLLDAGISTGEDEITLELLQSLRPFALHDGASEAESHYSLISALIKSIRGSDIEASIYYLARLVSANENPEFIARRLVILASEDIGNANPNALNLATSTLLAVGKIGYPESRIILSQCVIYLASSPKSNTAYKAINQAMEAIKNGLILEVPENIMPHSTNYLYPHEFGGYVEQNYLSEELKDIHFVETTTKGFEKTLNEWHTKITQKDKQDMDKTDEN